MQIKTTNNPSSEVALHIEELIKQHGGTTLLLLAGGSALNIVSKIKLDDYAKGRTIFMMGDERWSREKSENNYLQLQDQLTPGHGLKLVETNIKENENLTKFTTRLNLEFEKIISCSDKLQTICILGVGTDGHTASIFPMAEESFFNTSKQDVPYVSVHVESLKINSRASITPDFIKNQVNHVIGYAVGETKKSILNSLINESKPINEMPAQLIKLHKNSILVTDQIL